MGLTAGSAADCLALVLPNGADRWIGLLEVLPTALVDATECGTAGYARVAHSSWVSTTAVAAVSRHNVGTIELPELAADTTVRGWAVYDAPADGAMVAWGELRDGGGVATEVTMSAGDRPRFLDGELVLEVSL